jgi:hypothetical protein
MILHLEAATRDSQIFILDINESAAMCFQWLKFIVHTTLHKALLRRMDLYRGEPKIMCFKCPTCAAKSPLLSSLFMHVESPACGQGLEEGAIGKLKKWLENRHG